MEEPKCPKCGNKMGKGFLAWYEPLAISRIVFQEKKPGYIRFKAPKDGLKVMKPPVFGKGDPEGFICKDCKWVSFQYSE